jgi:hypothetical protein
MTILRVLFLVSSSSITILSHGINPNDYANFSQAERLELFDPYGHLYKENASTFFKLIPLGVQDNNPEVRRRAAQAAALILQSLQHDPQSHIPGSVTEQDFLAVTESLSKVIYDEHAEIRGAAYAALVASESPNAAMEKILLQRLLAEADDELRGAIVSYMVAAGYQSASFKRAIINRFPNAESKELRALAAAVERLGITAALPAMLDRLGGSESAQRSILSAIRSFGKLAFSSRKKLEEMAADPNGTYKAEVTATLESLDNAPQPVKQVPPYQPLLSKVSVTAIPENGSSSPTTSGKIQGTENVMAEPFSKNGLYSERSIVAVVAVMALAAMGLTWLLLKKRH